ncbi:MAG: hypothetical protein ABSF69_29470 [Polyangiaceae bacterium]|jgi:hypothetical protein
MRSNIWIAEVGSDDDALVLHDVRRVQRLPGTGLPFDRLVALLSAGRAGYFANRREIASFMQLCDIHDAGRQAPAIGRPSRYVPIFDRAVLRRRFVLEQSANPFAQAHGIKRPNANPPTRGATPPKVDFCHLCH